MPVKGVQSDREASIMRLSDDWAYHYEGEHHCLKCIGEVTDSTTTQGEVEIDHAPAEVEIECCVCGRTW